MVTDHRSARREPEHQHTEKAQKPSLCGPKARRVPRGPRGVRSAFRMRQLQQRLERLCRSEQPGHEAGKLTAEVHEVHARTRRQQPVNELWERTPSRELEHFPEHDTKTPRE